MGGDGKQKRSTLTTDQLEEALLALVDIDATDREKRMNGIHVPSKGPELPTDFVSADTVVGMPPGFDANHVINSGCSSKYASVDSATTSLTAELLQEVGGRRVAADNKTSIDQISKWCSEVSNA